MELPKDFELDVGGVKYSGDLLYRQKIGSVEVGVQESPIYIHVDTDTDWATVIPATAGVIVALLAAWFTFHVQRNQIQGNIATYRHHWMSDLRDAGSELIQLLNYLANLTTKKKDYRKEQEYMDKSARASQLRAKIELLLSRDDGGTTEIRNALTEAVKAAVSLDYEEDPTNVHMKTGKLKNMLRAELESAWIDLKNDLGANKRFLFFRLVKKQSRINV